MKKLFRLISLTYTEKRLFSQTYFLVWLIRLSLWIFPSKRVVKWLSHIDSARINQQDIIDWEMIHSVTRSVRVCSQYVPSASCLTQALTTQKLLDYRGQDSQLKIGVNRDHDGEFMAHAWVEIDGKIIIGKLPHHESFKVLRSSGSVAI